MKLQGIDKVLIIGSGPIVIGQACEFDYSGTQACKALRENGYKIVLVNSNPATIMTDPVMADATYIEPLNVHRLEQIIAKERPDALLPNLGGQTGLNLACELSKAGVLDKYGVKVIGVNLDILSGKQDTRTFAYNTANQISSINGSALGGMDEAAVSGIASAYAQSAASGKLDTSAFNSGDFYTTANPSGFITGVDLTPYQPTSAMSGYIPTSLSSDFQQVTGMSSYALSSDVSSTVDLVSTQSANWGGSALQLSAGPGVKLEKSGNVLVASTDETVLWSSSGYSVGDTMQTYNLSGNPSDFEEIQVYGQRPLGSTDTMGAFEFRFHPAYLNANSVSKICVPFAFVAEGSVTPYSGGYSVIDINTTSWHDGVTWQYKPTTTYQGTAYVAHIHKIVGINRTAEA